jgi:twitching motility protein PilT
VNYKELLDEVIKRNASDIFLKIGAVPQIRVAGGLTPIANDVVPNEMMQELLELITDARTRKIFDTNGEVDGVFNFEGKGRFRVNIFRQSGKIGMVMRYVKSNIPSFESLGLPSQQLIKLATIPRGLVLVTGIAGSGKSTTLAAMIQYVSEKYRKHIITIEDPIEYVFKDRMSVIDQRELGIDTQSFSAALKHAVRQSPDIILIGEMRDKETIEAAISAAETGHTVFSTLHTMNAMQTIERITNFYQPHEHQFLRHQLALVLEGVVAQRLLPVKDGSARVPAIEIMLATPTIRELLHEGKTREIYKAIKEGSFYGTQTFNQSLKTLIQKDLVTEDIALHAADSPEELKMELRGIQRGTKAGDFNFKV